LGGLIAGIWFENSPATIEIKLKQTFRVYDLLFYAGGTIIGMLAVFSYLK
jgi:hypothetical protein